MAGQDNAPHHRPQGGRLDAAISEAVVRLLAESTGRGPTKARTTIDGDLIVVVLQDTLTEDVPLAVELCDGDPVSELFQAGDAVTSGAAVAIVV